MDEAAARRVERLRHEHALAEGLQRATATWEHGALRPFYVLNGGGIAIFVALFAQLSSQEESAQFINRAFAVWAVAIWSLGLIYATAASALGYFSQFAFRRSRDYRVEHLNGIQDEDGIKIDKLELQKTLAQLGIGRRKWSYFSAFLSLVSFLLGLFNAGASVTSDLFSPEVIAINHVYIVIVVILLVPFFWQVTRHVRGVCRAKKGEWVYTPPLFG